MDKTFIQNAKDDVDRDKRGEDQQSLIREGITKRRRGPFKIGLQARWEVHVCRSLIDFTDGRAERGIVCQVEGDSHSGKLALMGNGERLLRKAQAGKSTQGNGIRDLAAAGNIRGDGRILQRCCERLKQARSRRRRVQCAFGRRV